MQSRQFFPRLIDISIVLCLVLTLGARIYGHCDASGSDLSLMDSYITEYMKKAPHWPWLVVASFAFALLLFLLAIQFLSAFGMRLPVVIGCLLLAATAMGNFFVAYAPMRRVEQPSPTAHEWWTPTWWFTSQTSRTPYENGMADAYSDVHYRAIRLVVTMGLAGITFIAAGLVSQPPTRMFAWCTFASVVAMAVLFWLGDHVREHHGLWQRLGFVVMYGWLWQAWRRGRSQIPSVKAQGT